MVRAPRTTRPSVSNEPQTGLRTARSSSTNTTQPGPRSSPTGRKNIRDDGPSVPRFKLPSRRKEPPIDTTPTIVEGVVFDVTRLPPLMGMDALAAAPDDAVIVATNIPYNIPGIRNDFGVNLNIPSTVDEPEPATIIARDGTIIRSPVSSPRVSPVSSPRVSPVSSPRVSPVSSPRVSPVSSPRVSPVSSPRVSPVSSPRNQTASPRNQTASPRNQTASPRNQTASPRNQTASPASSPRNVPVDRDVEQNVNLTGDSSYISLNSQTENETSETPISLNSGTVDSGTVGFNQPPETSNPETSNSGTSSSNETSNSGASSSNETSNSGASSSNETSNSGNATVEVIETPEYDIIKPKDFSRLNELEQTSVRTRLKINLIDVATRFPIYGIKESDYDDSVPLEVMQVKYENYHRNIVIKREMGNYKIWLTVGWSILQGILAKMNLPIDGYFDNQIKMMSSYDRLLEELAENDYAEAHRGGVPEPPAEKWSVFWKIGFVSLVHALVLVLINFFLRAVEAGTRKEIVSTIVSYLTNSNSQPITNGEPGAHIPSVPDSGGMFGNFDFSQIASFIGPLMGMLGPSNQTTNPSNIPGMQSDDYTLPFE